ncbi:MAG: tyrosine-type recombinase/integrase [Hyphomicrobiales bacterium]|nr:tyrosine-type recombinase/integrase [Hyphomicrobiales bacterium]
MPLLTTQRLTKRIIDALEPGSLVWDPDVKGFGVRCQGASKTFIFKTRIEGKQRWITIGRYGSPWTVETARKEAQRILGDILKGVDLAGLRDEKQKSPTVEMLCQRFLADYAPGKKKASSIAEDRRNIENHVVPVLGQKKVADITKDDIEKLKRDIFNGKTARPAHYKTKHASRPVKGGPIAANRCLALLSTLFNIAEEWKLRPKHSNPVSDVDRYRERARQTYLSSAQLGRLFALIDANTHSKSANCYAMTAISLFLYTGARLSEILTLKWEYVDFERRFIILPDSKTHAKPIFLNEPAIVLLKSLPRAADNPYVLVGKKPFSHLVNLQKPWNQLRNAAGLPDVRIHDLRHTYASYAGANGASLLNIGQLLGHSRAQTTMRYTHLVAGAIRDINDRVGQHLADIAAASTAGSPLQTPDDKQI